MAKAKKKQSIGYRLSSTTDCLHITIMFESHVIASFPDVVVVGHVYAYLCIVSVAQSYRKLYP